MCVIIFDMKESTNTDWHIKHPTWLKTSTNIVFVASLILGLSIITSATISSCASSRNRYEFKSDSSKVLILDKKTGSLYISDGRQIKEIRVSDKRIHEYVNGEDLDCTFNKLYEQKK